MSPNSRAYQDRACSNLPPTERRHVTLASRAVLLPAHIRSELRESLRSAGGMRITTRGWQMSLGRTTAGMIGYKA